MEGGRVSVSEWRCWMPDLRTELVAMRRIWFLIHWSLRMLVQLVVGNQVGVA